MALGLIASLAATAIGAIVAGIGTVGEADAAEEIAESQNEAAEYNAQLYESNAEIVDLQTKYVEAKGGRDSVLYGMRVAELVGSQRAAYAASGAVVDQGSAYHVTMDTVTWGAFDAMTILNNSKMEALGLKAQSEDLRERARITRLTKQDPTAARDVSLLSSATSFGGNLFNIGISQL